jgi:hypothetical protein
MIINNKSKTIHLVLAVLLIVSLTSCKKDDPNPVDQQINQLKGTWKLGSISNDNQDVTAQFTGFTLTFTDKNYATTNGGNPWPVNGTYDFKSTDLKSLLRSDNTVVTIDQLTTTALVLSFNYTNLTNGRVSGVTGNFTFSLIK